MLRSLFVSASLCAALLILASTIVTPPVKAQTPSPSPPAAANRKNSKEFNAEDLAEAVIIIYGSRQLLTQIRRNGVERGRVCKPNCETGSKAEEAIYERRFVRGDSSEKDRIRLDQKMPSLEYSLIYGDGRLWGIINGASFTPRQDAANTFMSQHRHSIENLLRYKEDGSTLTLIGKDKQKGIELHVLDVIGKDKEKTRYYISAKTLHIMWLEYEDAGSLKFRRTFHDYRYAQGTLVPYRSVLLQDGHQTQETRILNVTFGTKIDDAVFKSPEA